MPVTFDAVSSSSTTASSSLTFNHTVAAQNNRILLVGVASEEGSSSGNLVITGITYGGVALTKLDAQQEAPGAVSRVELWYLINPLTGTNSTVVTATGVGNAVYGMSASAISYYGASTSAPTYAGAHGTGTAVSVSIATSLANTMLVDVVVNGTQGNTITATSPQAERVNQENGTVFDWGISEKLIASPTSTSMAWTISGSSRWAIVSAAIAPFVAVESGFIFTSY